MVAWAAIIPLISTLIGAGATVFSAIKSSKTSRASVGPTLPEAVKPKPPGQVDWLNKMRDPMNLSFGGALDSNNMSKSFLTGK